MNLEILTFIIGFIGILLMMWQLNHQINQRFDAFEQRFDSFRTEIRTEIREVESNLRSEFKSDLNTLEVKLNTLLMGLFRQYPPPEQYPKQDQGQ